MDRELQVACDGAKPKGEHEIELNEILKGFTRHPEEKELDWGEPQGEEVV